jgi:Flp pilus assembly pilin Flp
VKGLTTLLRPVRALDERGAVSTEYALILTLVAMATLLAIGAVGAAVAGLFEQAPPAFP